MLATIVSPNLNTAQLFFLIAVIVGIIIVVCGFAKWAYYLVLVPVVLVFMSLGLLFSG